MEIVRKQRRRVTANFDDMFSTPKVQWWKPYHLLTSTRGYGTSKRQRETIYGVIDIEEKGMTIGYTSIRESRESRESRETTKRASEALDIQEAITE